jgi:hypothetical protein
MPCSASQAVSKVRLNFIGAAPPGVVVSCSVTGATVLAVDGLELPIDGAVVVGVAIGEVLVVDVDVALELELGVEKMLVGVGSVAVVVVDEADVVTLVMPPGDVGLVVVLAGTVEVVDSAVVVPFGVPNCMVKESFSAPSVPLYSTTA